MPHIEVGLSQIKCAANQLTGFYIRVAMAFNGLNSWHIYVCVNIIRAN